MGKTSIGLQTNNGVFPTKNNQSKWDISAVTKQLISVSKILQNFLVIKSGKNMAFAPETLLLSRENKY